MFKDFDLSGFFNITHSVENGSRGPKDCSVDEGCTRKVENGATGLAGCKMNDEPFGGS